MSTSSGLSRREFFRTSGVMGAGALLPFARSRAGVVLKGLIPPEEIIPGVSYWPNSTCGECHAGCGVKVRIREGKAVKIEGNEQHPVNHGGLCARGQSALQALYSPARVRSPLRRTADGPLQPISWTDAGEEIANWKGGADSGSSGKIVVVSRHLTGGMRAMLDNLIASQPRIEVVIHEPLEYASLAAANEACFGIEAIPTYKLEEARTIVSFGADLFETWLSPVSNAYGFGCSRDISNGAMCRLIQFESHLSLTGANADERYVVPPGADMFVAMAIASLLLSDGALPAAQLKAWRAALEPFTVEQAAAASGISPAVIRKIADRLKAQKPALAVAGGPTGRTEHATRLQVAVNLINFITGSYGKTITFDRTENAPVGSYARLVELVEDMETGRVDALIVHDTNLEFMFSDVARMRAAIGRVPFKVQLASVEDPSMGLFDMVVPVHHWLERWDLLEPRSGVYCLQQPVLDPRYDSCHPGQVLSDILFAWAGEPAMDYEEFLLGQWKEVLAGQPLVDGGYWSDPVTRKVSLNPKAVEVMEGFEPTVPVNDRPILLPITTVKFGEGRQTGRPWLHELPDPITMVAWDTPLLISPSTAKKWRCHSGDIVKLALPGGGFDAPVYVQNGMSDAVVAVQLGSPGEKFRSYNYDPALHPFHALAGDIDKKSGALSWLGPAATFEGIAGKIRLARVQGGDRQGNRGIAQAVALSDTLETGAARAGHSGELEVDLYPKHEHPVHDWTMSIDLSLCIGCGACAVACQAENNVPVVGKDQVVRGRELSWLRIERFIDKERVVFLPMLCQHCEHAPCETVCPVYASVHSSEGLNQQVYNRCVGTRYCANNCPYKVRRFNWYTYKTEPPLDEQFSPDVYLRSRGIMEKCTFCIQRIREYKEIAKDEKRPLRDGEVTPACAQSCPTRAIVFGDLNDPESRIARLVNDPRGYWIFEQLNTQPSIVYLKRVFHADGTVTRNL